MVERVELPKLVIGNVTSNALPDIEGENWGGWAGDGCIRHLLRDGVRTSRTAEKL